MRRQRKTYEKPLKRWDKKRLEEESKLVKNFGLKNKKELWRAQTIIKRFRSRARQLFVDDSGREALFSKLKRLGIFKSEVHIDDILGLKTNALLERRLQTQVFRQGMATSPKQARQFITHKHISIDGKVVDIPSYTVTLDEENKISFSNNSVIKDPNHPIKHVKAPKEKPKAETKVEAKKETAKTEVKTETPKAEVKKEEAKAETKVEVKTEATVEKKDVKEGKKDE